MQKWEYRVEKTVRVHGTWNDSTYLDRLGEEGWELVSCCITDDPWDVTLIFKRAKV